MSGDKPVKLAFNKATPKELPEKSRPPVILHHGLTRSKERWRKLLQPLADKTQRTVYAVDARNHGESEQSDVFNFDILAEDLANFLQSMDIPRATIVGHSMGGVVAMKLALTKPERVEALVVEDMPPKKLEPELCSILATILSEQDECVKNLTSASETPSSVQQKLRECVYRTVPMIPDSDYQVLEATDFPIRKTDDGRYELRVNAKVITRALLHSSTLMEPYSGRFDGPALFIYGEDSQMGVAESKDTIRELFPKASVNGVPGVAHEVYTLVPDEYERQLLQFLETLNLKL